MKENNTVVSESVWQFVAWCVYISNRPVQLECKWTVLFKFILLQIMTSLMNMIKTSIVLYYICGGSELLNNGHEFPKKNFTQ